MMVLNIAPISRLLFTALLLAGAAASALELASPDGRVNVTIDLAKTAREGVVAHWAVQYRDTPLLARSALGLELESGPFLDGSITLADTRYASEDTVWKPVYGERSRIPNRYHGVALVLEDERTPPRRLDIEVRAYDEGAAVCYHIPGQPGLGAFTITSERTQFRFTADHDAWAVYSAQGEYTRVPLTQVKARCERPLTVLAEGCAAAVAEARLVDYARMRLNPIGRGVPGVMAHLDGRVDAEAPYTTPWRVLMAADNPCRLLEQNYLLLNLNAPCAIADPSWIRPGKVIRETTLTTEGGKACIDFAAERGLQYIEYDAGWYGDEYDEVSDATTITRSEKKAGIPGQLDLHEVIRYGEERGIGVWVYVNRRQLEKQLETLLPLYRDWGIKGVKYGFVQVGNQRWTDWLHNAVRLAADNRLMVDIHDEYRPTGYSRTYPNLLTQEGIRGNEEMPPPWHNCVLPFTRFLCGAGDYTFCWYSGRIQTTHAHQLAASVAYYSPLQFLFWYDRPAQYQGEPELEFWKHLPTTWDETRVLQGEIGAYAVIARRSGADWFLGAINARERRTLETPLGFLDGGEQYTAHLHTDASPEGGAPTAVYNETRRVTHRSVLRLDCADNGGAAVRLTPMP